MQVFNRYFIGLHDLLLTIYLRMESFGGGVATVVKEGMKSLALGDGGGGGD